MQPNNDNDMSNEKQAASPMTEKANEPLLKDEKVAEAHKQAEEDIATDRDFALNPNDDLDEGEFARLGDDDTETK